MARKPMVTRTIKTTEVTLLCLNIETAEPCNRTVIIPRTYPDDKTAMKFIEKNVEFPENLKPVHIVNTEEKSVRYGMAETDFIKSAVILADEEFEEVEEA